MTQRYIHLDAALVIAADQVAAEVARLLDGGSVMSMKDVKRRRHLKRNEVLAGETIIDALNMLDDRPLAAEVLRY